jgi:hypothetical protein
MLIIHDFLDNRNRMLASALNFAIGFFGYPFEGQYQQSITIESNGVCDCVFPLSCSLLNIDPSSIIPSHHIRRSHGFFHLFLHCSTCVAVVQTPGILARQNEVFGMSEDGPTSTWKKPRSAFRANLTGSSLVSRMYTPCSYFARTRWNSPSIFFSCSFLNFPQTVAIGYSKFCELFTREEWEGFNYAYVLSSSF